MFPRRITIALLALGTLGGYGAGFASLHHRRQHAPCCDHRERGDRDDRGERGRGYWTREWHEDPGDDGPR